MKTFSSSIVRPSLYVAVTPANWQFMLSSASNNFPIERLKKIS